MRKLYTVTFAIEFNREHISKKTMNQYRKLNYSHLETRKITLTLINLYGLQNSTMCLIKVRFKLNV